MEETLAVATYIEATVESQAAAAMEAQAAAAVVPWRSWWRRGEERMRPEGDIFRSRFLPMLIYHVPMNLAICHTGRGATAL
jgi:hypothetical protein